MTDTSGNGTTRVRESELFDEIRLRDLSVRNRLWVSPMCQYSAEDGFPDDWHLVHLGSLARGGMGLVMTEATAVSPEGRITPADTGIWNERQQEAWVRIVRFIHGQGARAGMQLAHAGRKASCAPPWEGRKPLGEDQGGWLPVAPSSLPYPGLKTPRAMSTGDIGRVVECFADAASRSVRAGFDVIELHAAHGYLLHEFLSPLSNQRNDEYGGSIDNRMRLLLEVVAAVRAVAPPTMPLLVRISATDWLEGGWDVDDSVRLATRLREAGVDLVDVTSGGNSPADIHTAPGYQVSFSHRIRQDADVPTGAVGLITEPKQAEEVVSAGSADVVFLGRALLREPHWALRAAHELHVPIGEGVTWPVQYVRAARD